MRARALAAAGLALAAACGGEARAPRRHAVELRQFVFAPAALAAAPGDTVVFTNRDLVPHTATAEGGAWDSGELAPGASWTLVVPAGGLVPYKCAYHPTMLGRLVRGE
jgi:plastocyanin